MNQKRLIGSVLIHFWIPVFILFLLNLNSNWARVREEILSKEDLTVSALRLIATERGEKLRESDIEKILSESDFHSFLFFEERNGSRKILLSNLSKTEERNFLGFLASPIAEPKVVEVSSGQIYFWKRHLVNERLFGFGLGRDVHFLENFLKALRMSSLSITLLLFSLLLNWIWSWRLSKGLETIQTFLEERIVHRKPASLPPLPAYLSNFKESLRGANEALASTQKDNKKDRRNLRGILASMSEAVISLDSSDKILFYNHSAEEIFDLPTEISVEGIFQQIIRVPKLHELVRRAKELGKPMGNIIQYFSKSGQITMDAFATPIKYGNEKGIVLVLRDLTEFEKTNRIRSDFVANASHELRTPITSIRGFAEALGTTPEPDPKTRQRFLRKISEQTTHLTNLIKDLLNLAEIERQEDSRSISKLDLGTVLEEANERFQSRIREKELDLVFSIQERDLQIFANRDTLEQVLDNLLENAVKYTKKGGRIEVSAFEKNPNVIIEIKDSGIGISPEDVDRVFERFYRTQRARETAPVGTGLGLAIVKHLVEASRAKITIQSVVEQGTTVTLSWPNSP